MFEPCRLVVPLARAKFRIVDPPRIVVDIDD